MVDRENLVRKIRFPRLAIPLSVVLHGDVQPRAQPVVVFIFALSPGVRARWTWLELPVLLGIWSRSPRAATLLSALFVRFRDLAPIWEVVLQVLFYASLIIVPFETVVHEYPTVARLLLINPLAAVVQQARHAVVDPSVPSAASAMGGQLRLLAPLGVTLSRSSSACGTSPGPRRDRRGPLSRVRSSPTRVA